MASGAAVHRSSGSAPEKKAATGGAKVAPRAGQRIALSDITNLVVRGCGELGAADSAPDVKFSSTKPLADAKKGGSFASLGNVNTERGSIRKTTSGQFDPAVLHHNIALHENVFLSCMPCIVPAGGNSPGPSEDSASMEDAMSTFNSMGSPDFECDDYGDSSMAASLHCLVDDKLHISDSEDVAAFNWKIHSPIAMKGDNVFYIDNNQEDLQLCATLVDDIYKNLREAEVVEEFRLFPETLYLTVNYIDRYLSIKVISRHKLQLLGIACLLIAVKYEEICPPQVEELCYLTDDSYTKHEVLQMEASVLNYLGFEMTAPTAKCFLM